MKNLFHLPLCFLFLLQKLSRGQDLSTWDPSHIARLNGSVNSQIELNRSPSLGHIIGSESYHICPVIFQVRSFPPQNPAHDLRAVEGFLTLDSLGQILNTSAASQLAGDQWVIWIFGKWVIRTIGQKVILGACPGICQV